MKSKNNIRYSCQHIALRNEFTTLLEGRYINPVELSDGKPYITWAIGSYPENDQLDKKKVDEIMQQAFDVWEPAFLPIKFKKVLSVDDAQIKIYNAKRDHSDTLGCPYHFDGESGVLAHAFPPHNSPLSLNVHLDGDEYFSTKHVDITGEYDLLTIMIHELGHCFNGGHSEVKEAIMYPAYTGEKRQLHQDDLDLIDALYGEIKSLWKTKLGWHDDNIPPTDEPEPPTEETPPLPEPPSPPPPRRLPSGCFSLILFVVCIIFAFCSTEKPKEPESKVKVGWCRLYDGQLVVVNGTKGDTVFAKYFKPNKRLLYAMDSILVIDTITDYTLEDTILTKSQVKYCLGKTGH